MRRPVQPVLLRWPCPENPVRRHAPPAALLLRPGLRHLLAGLGAAWLATLLAGSFIVEQFFSIPGIGRAFVQAVFARDYGMIMGTTLFYAVIVAFANLAVDLLYGIADPRVGRTGGLR